MARSIDTASLSFGLVAIPVKIYATTERSHEVHFHMIHADCSLRLKQQYVCPKHGKVERDDIAKGYEIARGRMIELAPDELDALDAVGTDEIGIREFVPASAVDPIFVERTYYLGPDRGGARAYRLLRDALRSAELVAIATFAARGNSYLEMVRPFQDGLAMHQLRFPDEIRPFDEIELGDLAKPTARELELAERLVSQLHHARFEPTAYTDEVKERVRALLADKAKSGEEIVVTPEAAKGPQVTDLMAALRASLGNGEHKPTKREPAHGHRRARTTRAAHRRRAA